MSDDPPRPAPRDDQRSCRKCGLTYDRALPRCPACGAYPGRRRRLSPSGKWHQPIAERIRTALPWFRGNRIYFLYIGAGLLIGALSMPVLMFLAEQSRPEDWRFRRSQGMDGFSFRHFIDPFIAAGETLARWLYEATVGSVRRLFAWAWLTIQTYPSVTIVSAIGATIGALLAYRKKSKARSDRSGYRRR